jgi:hypothetical protein
MVVPSSWATDVESDIVAAAARSRIAMNLRARDVVMASSFLHETFRERLPWRFRRRDPDIDAAAARIHERLRKEVWPL